MTARDIQVPRLSPGLERLLAVRIQLNVEVAIYVALFAAAFALRFWDLGANALHHDESIHAQWSWRLASGDYTHSPVFHGPFYYHVQSLVFIIFGATDYTARVSAAIFGMALVALPLLLRRWIGSVGAIAAVAFLAFSPTVVYYSRFFREDIYFAFFNLLMFAAVWRYIASGRDRWLIVFAVGLVGAYTTKEAAFLTSAVFLVYLNGYLAAELARATLESRGTAETWRRILLTAAYFPYAWAAASLWPMLRGLRRAAGWDELPRAGDLLIILGTLTLPLLVAFLKDPLESGLPVFRDLPLLSEIPIVGRGIIDAGRLDYPAVCSAGTGSDYLAMGGLFAIVGGAAAFVGLQWRPRTWLIAAGACAIVYTTLMTSFWTNFDGLCTGPWGSLDYWRSQQEVRRGNQPWFYYDMLMPLYEYLPLIIAAGGLWWATVRGNAFSRFLVVWLLGYWAGLSWAGEKMPWLNTHLAVPTALLAAYTINRAWQHWRPSDVNRAVLSLVSLVLVAGGTMLVLVWGLPGAPTAIDAAIRIAALVLLALVVIGTLRLHGRRSLGTALAATVVGGLAFFSVRTMVVASFEHGDVPHDMLIYTQSSPDVTRIADQVDRLAAASGKGDSLRIGVDGELNWPLVWYFRDYVVTPNMSFSDGLPAGDFDVFFVSTPDLGVTTQQLAADGDTRYAAPIRYVHRAAFPEVYKTALPTGPWSVDTWDTLWSGVTSGDLLDTWFHYWRDRKAPEAFWDFNGAVFFPANFDPEAGTLSTGAVGTSEPGVDADGNPVFGGIGANPGRFLSPVDIETDGDGNLYVIDSSLSRLQKFDAEGNLLASAELRELPEAAGATEPWGLEVTRDGHVVVADTFGWSVRVFDPALRHVVTFGEASNTDAEVGPFELYGPRDVAEDADGNLWVTDTGHNRIVVYTVEGDFVRAIGAEGTGPGEFTEPVGIDIAPDGKVFVADMFNGRVQMLDATGAYEGEFSVEGWGGRNATDKPYLRVLANGNIALSLPDQNEVRVYDRTGEEIASIVGDSEPLQRPYAIAETADGRLWISEGDAARVRLLPIP